MTFLHVLIHSARDQIVGSFVDLMQESLSHMKHYGRKLAGVGLLTLPPVIPKNEEPTGDLRKFLKENIEEEEVERSELSLLAKKLNSPEFQILIDFVDNQERYHIHLLKSALGDLEKKEED